MASAGEQFVEKIVKLPTPQKVAICVFIAGALTAGNYFLFVQPAQDQATRELKRMRKLEEDLFSNQQIANNLSKYRKEKELLEQQLAKALAELPEEANIEALIQSLHEIGNKSGVTISLIEPRSESKAQFYASIPLTMKISGNFHEIGVFFDSISKLKRIVNITDIRLSAPRMKNEKVLVDADYTATTFRFLEPAKKEEKK